MYFILNDLKIIYNLLYNVCCTILMRLMKLNEENIN